MLFQIFKIFADANALNIPTDRRHQVLPKYKREKLCNVHDVKQSRDYRALHHHTNKNYTFFPITFDDSRIPPVAVNDGPQLGVKVVFSEEHGTRGENSANHTPH